MNSEQFKIVDKEYGKSWVKILHIKREGLLHTIREYEVDTKLTLNSEKDYITGDNSDVIATDSQKNTVYLLAKKHGVGSPEQFATLLSKHFIQKYYWVEKAKVRVEAQPWKRIETEGGQEHNHAFVSSPVLYRHATVTLTRGSQPEVVSGLKGLRILKTTQSGFVNFVRDEYRSLPDAPDRIFSTVVEASWKYRNTISCRAYDLTFDEIHKTILDLFAGEPNRGLFSPSVQQTMYLTQKAVLRKISHVEWMQMAMPNKHYFPVDLSKFPESVGGGHGNDSVFLPVDKPSGMIEATLARKDLYSKL